MTRRVKHDGKIGDLIYAMAALRGLYNMTGVKSRVLLLSNTELPFTKKQIEYVSPLVECQDYIEGVEFSDDSQDCDLDLRGAFDVPHFERINIAKLYCDSLQVDDRYCKEPWLSIPEMAKSRGKRILVCRTGNYSSANTKAVWKNILTEYTPSDFIGLKTECDAFNDFAGTTLPCLEYDNALLTAQTIFQSDRLLCDQTSSLAIANGLGVPVTVEVAKQYPDCIFERSGAEYRGVSKSVLNECKVVWSNSAVQK